MPQNFSPYILPQAPRSPGSIAGDIKDWRQLDMQQQQVDQSKVNADRNFQQQAAELQQRQVEAADQNKRQDNLINWYRENESNQRQEKDKEATRQVLASYLSLLGKGNKRGAMAMIPLLPNYGIKISSRQTPQGEEFRLEAPEWAKPGGQYQPTQSQTGTFLSEDTGKVGQQGQAIESESPWFNEENPANAVSAVAQSQAQAPQGAGPVLAESAGRDPSTVNLGELDSITQQQLAPLLGGFVRATPQDYRQNAAELATATLNSGLGYEDAEKQLRENYQAVSPMWRAEMMGQNQLASQGARQQSQERLAEGQTWKQLEYTANKADLSKRKAVLNDVGLAQELLDPKNTNPQSASMAITLIAKMTQSGVLTDKDFERSNVGVQSWWQQVKRGVEEKIPELLDQAAIGMTPDVRANLQNTLSSVERANGQIVEQVRDSLMQAAPDEASPDRETVERFVRMNIPTKYWPESMRGEPKKKAHSSRNVPTDGDTSLGVQPVPSKEDVQKFLNTPRTEADDLLDAAD